MIQLPHTHTNNIRGVYHYDTGKSGPQVCLSCLTHGGELAGLHALHYLLNDFAITTKIKSGSVIFTLNNIQAYEQFVRDGDFGKARFIDANMNRIATPEAIIQGQTSEGRRLAELSRFFVESDYHIDLHSTTQSPQSIAIYSERGQKLASVLNTAEHYCNLIRHQVGKPVIDICERSGGIGIGLESGLETDKSAYHTMIDTILRILTYLDMLDADQTRHHLSPRLDPHIFDIYGSIIVDDPKTFVLTKNRRQGELIHAGSTIASQDGKPIIVDSDSIIILPTSILYPKEEYCFLATRRL